MRVNHHHCRVKKVAFLAFLWPSWGFKRPKYYICIVLYLIVFHGISRSSSFLWRTGKLSCSASSHLVQLGSFVLSFFLHNFCRNFVQFLFSLLLSPQPSGKHMLTPEKHIMVMVMMMPMMIWWWWRLFLWFRWSVIDQSFMGTYRNCQFFSAPSEVS